MRSLWIAAVLLTGALADSTTSAPTSSAPDVSDTASFVTLSNTVDPLSIDGATGTVTYPSISTTITVSTTSPDITATTSTTGNTTDTVSFLVGSQTTLTGPPNSTYSLRGSLTTSTAVLPTNTQACNGYVEFCGRNYSNITYIAAHNSPFYKQGNVGSNQQYSVTTQLNDGVRMLQFQAHLANDTLYLCHTSCELLNVGTLEDYFSTVVTWLEINPYEVITILMGNFDLVNVGNFSGPIVDSGLSKYAYEPPQIPMGLNDWPVLSDMIISGKRAVIFMDYNANQTEFPYILDEFSQMWETPFSPTDSDFPCTEQRPPDLPDEGAEEMMYMANHNLNLDVEVSGMELLIPNTIVLNETNAVSGFRSLGLMANVCTATWGRPPNFLLVDYYNQGSAPGSVFEVAATHNNVTYNGHCCNIMRSGTSSLQPLKRMHWVFATALVILFNFA